MKRLALLLTLTAIVATAFAQDSEKWVKLKSSEGEFKVAIPGQWEHVHTEFGSKDAPTTLHINVYESDKANAATNVRYAVSWADLNTHVDADNTDAVQDLFDAQIERVAAAHKGGTPVSDATTSYQDNPGSDVELSYDNEKGKIFLRMFLVHNRLYLLEVTGMADQIKRDDLDRFFESLEIKF